jgi:AraC-like DNA-binding protein
MIHYRTSYVYHYRNTTIGHYKETFHAHREAEFCYVHEGVGDLWIEGKHYEVVPGTLLFFQPFQLHRVRMEVTEQQPFVRTVLTFEPEWLETTQAAFPGLRSFLYELLDPHQFVPLLSGWNEADFMIHHMEHSARLMPSLSLPEQQEEYIQLLLTLLRLIRAKWVISKEKVTRVGNPRPDVVQQMMLWVDTHYAEEFHMKQMAEDLHLTANYLSHLFRDVTGNTITDYVMAQRLRQACHLLMTTHKTIPHIASEVGLTNASYFCQMFKRKQGISPHQYRLLYRRDHHRI